MYERRVKEKSEEQGLTIATTSYLNSIEKPILDIFVTAQWVPVATVADITEAHLESCVEERAEIKPEDYDLAQIESGTSKIRMDRSQKSLEMQMWKLGLQYATKLEDLGYSSFIDTQPRLVIEHIIKRLTHEQLQKRMKLTFRLRKTGSQE